jgi:hypothetical protein
MQVSLSLFDCATEIISMFVSFLVAFMGYKTYKLTSEKKHKYFAVSFTIIGISFIVLLATNLILLFQTNIGNLLNVFNRGYFVYSLLITIGYIVLVILSLNINNKAALFLLLTVIISFVLSLDNALLFHLLTTLALLFVVPSFFSNYRSKKTTLSLLVFISFVFMLIARSLLVFVSYSNIMYNISNIIQLVGFVILFYVIIRCLLNARKKNKTGNCK